MKRWIVRAGPLDQHGDRDHDEVIEVDAENAALACVTVREVDQAVGLERFVRVDVDASKAAQR